MITYTHCIILTWSQDGSICTRRRALNTSQSGYITCHGGHASRILSHVGGENRQKLEAPGQRQLTSLSTREIIQCLSICFIDNRPKAKQIK